MTTQSVSVSDADQRDDQSLYSQAIKIGRCACSSFDLKSKEADSKGSPLSYLRYSSIIGRYCSLDRWLRLKNLKLDRVKVDVRALARLYR